MLIAHIGSNNTLHDSLAQFFDSCNWSPIHQQWYMQPHDTTIMSRCWKRQLYTRQGLIVKNSSSIVHAFSCMMGVGFKIMALHQPPFWNKSKMVDTRFSIASKHTVIACILNYSSCHFNNKVQKPCSSIESIYGILEKNMSVMKVVRNHAKLYILSLP